MTEAATSGPPASNDAQRSGAPMIALGAAANLMLFVVTVATSLWISPHLVRGLGDSRYGAWTLVAQLTGFFGVIDLGTRNAVGFFVAQYLARGDQAGANRITSTAFSTLLVVGSAILVFSGILAWLVPVFFHTPLVSTTDIRAATLVLGAAMGIALPFDVFAAALGGARRQHYMALAETATRLATTLLMAVALAGETSLPVLATIQLGGRAVTWISLLIVAYRAIPGLEVNTRLSDRETFREIFGYGSASFIVNLSLLLIDRLDAIVIGSVLGTAVVTIYAIGQQLTWYALNVVSVVATSFSPQFAHLAATGDRARSEHLLLSGTRLVGLLSLGVVVGLLLYGSPFIGLWQQERFVTGRWQARSDVILWILLAGLTPRLLQLVSWHYLFTNRRVKFLVKAQIVEAVANVSLSFPLARLIGLPGVALGSMLPLLINHLIVIPRYTSRVSGVPLKRIAGAMGIPAVLALGWLGIGFGLRELVPVTGWLSLILQVALMTAIICASALAFGLLPSERAWLRHRVMAFLGLGRSRDLEPEDL